MNDELMDELKKCLDRYWRTMALPLDQRAPFAAGIAKLETRIEQLRAATGLDTERFIGRVREIMRLLYGMVIPMEALDVSEYDRVAGGLDRAAACFRMGDQKGAIAVLEDLERYAQEAWRVPKQEVLPV